MQGDLPGKSRPLQVLLAGEGSAAVRMLHLVVKGGHRVAGVFSPPAGPSAPHSPLRAAARSGGHATWPWEWLGMTERAGFVRGMGADLLLSLRLPVIVHPSTLTAFTAGAFNLHTGPLPAGAGLNAVSWALYRGERIHGATVHRMTEEIDGGPVAYGKTFPIGEEDRALDLLARSLREGLSLMESLIDQAAVDPAAIPSLPQDKGKRRVSGPGPPRGGAIDWETPARAVFNFIRACDYFPLESPWGHPHALLGRERIVLARARLTGRAAGRRPGEVGRHDKGMVHVACADEWLAVEKVLVGGEPVDAVEILRPGSLLRNGAPPSPAP